MAILSAVPPANAKETACWKILFVIGILFFGVMPIVQFVCPQVLDQFEIMDRPSRTATPSSNQLQIHRKATTDMSYEYQVLILIRTIIFNLFILVVYMCHTRYTQLTVNEDEMEITMGPWQWPLLKWIFSSQIAKHEIYAIVRKDSNCLHDVCCRGYCAPINWCCCHKSYSAYFWPCCCQGLSQDKVHSDMIEIQLTQDPCEFTSMCCKRCAPLQGCNLCSCYVYNRIGLSIKDESWIDMLKANNYPILDLKIGRHVQQEEQQQVEQETNGSNVIESGNDYVLSTAV